ncbi:hypothetical protein GQ43DRAFT_441004 [Delitschia confertaspora ATCC 74209]|uniref:Secreted protein n=1 Tax=Delitschia confertaspora ATCC 74209 TaxID=1513339 RepID=A0A9P4MS11_9PLEO|nr:hypothetical protein GQ43DRAFT_441004 [Delitschia confertaspora ATCC 74209]
MAKCCGTAFLSLSSAALVSSLSGLPISSFFASYSSYKFICGCEGGQFHGMGCLVH